MPAPGLDAVIFDFDGVIVESLDVKEDAFRLLFADHPEHVGKIVNLHRENLGVSRYEKFRTIYATYLERELTDAEMNRLDQRFSEIVYERVVACDFVSGAPELLEYAARRAPLFIASGTPEDELSRIVAARGLSHLFVAVRGSPTPKAQIVQQILDDRDYDPGGVLMVGDAMTDYRAAATNRVPFVGRVPEADPSPFAELHVPTVTDMAELKERWDEIVTRCVGPADAP